MKRPAGVYPQHPQAPFSPGILAPETQRVLPHSPIHHHTPARAARLSPTPPPSHKPTNRAMSGYTRSPAGRVPSIIAAITLLASLPRPAAAFWYSRSCVQNSCVPPPSS
ncbi:hypothetical protein CALVIDRAFT_539409 [Calocera viscosa TUFC12733]|uniref:Uncharacterized protein n=1 Tax=Calocera viscosa (strain TUFC12733) TaxID=1330018 RepID=A0A167JXA1_CALVF|nr:hypothetical protein CALVIDRAFT_539409 [Calocera viscosa TUFC12733]